MKLKKLKKLDKYLPKNYNKDLKIERVRGFKKIFKFIFKPLVRFKNYYNNLTNIKVSFFIFFFLTLFLLTINYFTKPKILASNETVMGYIYQQENYINALSILIIGLSIRQFIVLNWMRYRKKPPASLRD